MEESKAVDQRKAIGGQGPRGTGGPRPSSITCSPHHLLTCSNRGLRVEESKAVDQGKIGGGQGPRRTGDSRPSSITCSPCHLLTCSNRGVRVAKSKAVDQGKIGGGQGPRRTGDSAPVFPSPAHLATCSPVLTGGFVWQRLKTVDQLAEMVDCLPEGDNVFRFAPLTPNPSPARGEGEKVLDGRKGGQAAHRTRNSRWHACLPLERPEAAGAGGGGGGARLQNVDAHVVDKGFSQARQRDGHLECAGMGGQTVEGELPPAGGPPDALGQHVASQRVEDHQAVDRARQRSVDLHPPLDVDQVAGLHGHGRADDPQRRRFHQGRRGLGVGRQGREPQAAVAGMGRRGHDLGVGDDPVGNVLKMLPAAIERTLQLLEVAARHEVGARCEPAIRSDIRPCQGKVAKPTVAGLTTGEVNLATDASQYDRSSSRKARIDR